MTVASVLYEISQVPGFGEVIPVIDPATEEQVAEFTDGGAAAVDAAVARATFRSGVWRDASARERAKILWRVADLIDEHGTELGELDSHERGMPPAAQQEATR
jgi:aldehyde dehydrogenase (NAD+)